VLSLHSAAQPAGDTPRAITPQTIADTDYPLGALLANEQGRVRLNLTIAPDGRVADAQVAQSSGAPRLDQAAVLIAKSRWRYEPARRGGQAVTSTITTEVNWVSPLRPVTENLIEVQPLPQAAQPPQPPARMIEVPGLYPPMSMARGEQGVVGVRYLVREDGSIGDAQLASSSGFERLDTAAVQSVRERWRFQPARVNGMPAQAWRGALVAYNLLPSTSYGARLRCYARPTLAQESVMIAAEQSFSHFSQLDADRIMVWRMRPVREWTALWIRVGANGVVDDALMETRGGWMRVPTPIVGRLIEGRVYAPAAGTPCWYYDPIAITG
jgi:TonB family protein